MQSPITRRRLVLILPILLVVPGVTAYEVGLHLWARHHFQAAEQALEQRDFRQAGGHLRSCLFAWPDDLSLHLLAGQTARRQGDAPEALEQLRIYEQKNGPPEPLAGERRLLRLSMGDLQEADELLAGCRAQPQAPETPLMAEAIIEASLKVVRAAFPLGLTAEGGEAAPDLARAREAVELWLQLRPGRADQAQGLVWRGLLHGFANEQPKALADLRRALELNPDHFEARMHLAVSLAAQAPEEAAVHLQMLHRRDPANTDVRFTLASVERHLGRLKEAGDLLDDLLAEDPENATLLVERGYVAMNARQLEDAERWLRRAVALAPEEPTTYLALSGYLYLVKREAEAKSYHDRGKQLDDARTRHREELAQKRKAGSGRP
jgi:predicted Zn-dependent protease